MVVNTFDVYSEKFWMNYSSPLTERIIILFYTRGRMLIIRTFVKDVSAWQNQYNTTILAKLDEHVILFACIHDIESLSLNVPYRAGKKLLSRKVIWCSKYDVLQVIVW